MIGGRFERAPPRKSMRGGSHFRENFTKGLDPV
jgi:hypothetical protein